MTVQIQGYDGKHFAITFRGVSSIRSLRPEGMILYSISELEESPPYRRFVFANSDDEAEEHLEITALSWEKGA